MVIEQPTKIAAAQFAPNFAALLDSNRAALTSVLSEIEP